MPPPPPSVPPQAPPNPAGSSVLDRFPFDPARLPFFYGWGVLAAGTLGVLMSAPGQTIGVSVFTDYLLQGHSISRESLGLAYMCGTALSAWMLSRVGRLYDRHGGRWVACAASGLLALALLQLSYSVTVARFCRALVPVQLGSVTTLVVLTLSFFFLRLFGQGALTLASRNMVLEWFEQRRGLANALLGVATAFGFSATPAAFESLIQTGGWQWAWRMLAGAATCFGLLAFVTYRRRPEDHGLTPDGTLGEGRRRATHRETRPGRAFTIDEARRTYSFWLLTLCVTLAALLITATTFHIVSIFGDAGLSREQAIGLFVPAAFIAVAFELLGSWLSDFIKLKYLVIVQLLGIITFALAIARLGAGLPILWAQLGMGMMQGMFGIVASISWPRFFGRTHLGAISGLAMSLVVAGTAVGPYVFAALRAFTGSYALAETACASVALILLVGATRLERPS